MNIKLRKKSAATLQLPGVLALASVGAATQATAQTVQITFTGSSISTSGGNQLDLDFGDDNVTELWGTTVNNVFGKRVGINRQPTTSKGAFASLLYVQSGLAYRAGVNNIATAGMVLSGTPILWPIKFNDANLLNGSTINGYLDITAFGGGSSLSLVVNRLVFDETAGRSVTGFAVTDPAFPEYNPNVVPELSSLGLLAMGAGGLLARRRRTMAI